MPDITALLAAATPRELAVHVCLAGDAAGELAELQGELEQAGTLHEASLAGARPDAELADRIADARARVQDATVTVRLRALGHRVFSALLTAHPPTGPGSQLPYDPATFLPSLLAACSVEPELTQAHVELLLDQINDGTAQLLFDAALAVNQESSPLPF